MRFSEVEAAGRPAQGGKRLEVRRCNIVIVQYCFLVHGDNQELSVWSRLHYSLCMWRLSTCTGQRYSSWMSSGVLRHGGVLIRKAVGAVLVLALALGRTLRRDYVLQLHGPKPLEAAICFISSMFDVRCPTRMRQLRWQINI